MRHGLLLILEKSLKRGNPEAAFAGELGQSFSGTALLLPDFLWEQGIWLGYTALGGVPADQGVSQANLGKAAENPSADLKGVTKNPDEDLTAAEDC